MRKIRFFIFCSAALLLILSASCASNGGESASRDESLFPEGAIVEFASEYGYRLRVDRSEGSVGITEPENLRGVVFTFRGTENRVDCGETSIPLSDGACAGGRDWLNAARAKGKRKGDTLAFVRDGACFEIKYENGEPTYVTITRGGIERRAAITVEKSD